MSQTKYRFRLPEADLARLRHAIMRETHVIVGDHPPEPRIPPSKLDSPIISRDRATLERRIDDGETSIPRGSSYTSWFIRESSDARLRD